MAQLPIEKMLELIEDPKVSDDELHRVATQGWDEFRGSLNFKGNNPFVDAIYKACAGLDVTVSTIQLGFSRKFSALRKLIWVTKLLISRDDKEKIPDPIVSLFFDKKTIDDAYNTTKEEYILNIESYRSDVIKEIDVINTKINENLYFVINVLHDSLYEYLLNIISKSQKMNIFKMKIDIEKSEPLINKQLDRMEKIFGPDTVKEVLLRRMIAKVDNDEAKNSSDPSEIGLRKPTWHEIDEIVRHGRLNSWKNRPERRGHRPSAALFFAQTYSKWLEAGIDIPSYIIRKADIDLYQRLYQELGREAFQTKFGSSSLKLG